MTPTARNIAIYPWFKFFQNLVFWQATWFLYFQGTLSGAEAIALYAVYDLVTTVLEVPSGYLSDRVGRKPSLLVSAACGIIGMSALGLGNSFLVFAIGQAFLGASAAFSSGTDSAILFESLKSEGRPDEAEIQELKAWRYEFLALAFSAVVGGFMAYVSPVLPFATSALAFLLTLTLAFAFTEPPHNTVTSSEAQRLQGIVKAAKHPVLLWLLALSILMYGFSHLPFVFGQPFILASVSELGLSAEAPIVSGAVATIMMVFSLIASAVAPKFRKAVGLSKTLLFAFGLQVLIAAVLALTTSVIAIGFLFL